MMRCFLQRVRQTSLWAGRLAPVCCWVRLPRFIGLTPWLPMGHYKVLPEASLQQPPQPQPEGLQEPV